MDVSSCTAVNAEAEDFGSGSKQDSRPVERVQRARHGCLSKKGGQYDAGPTQNEGTSLARCDDKPPSITSALPLT